MTYETVADGDRRPLPALAYCLLVFLFSRTVLELIGMGAHDLVFPVTDPQYRQPEFSPFVWLNIWGNRDSGGLLGTIEHGYGTALRVGEILRGQANWPLYPMLSKYAGVLTGLDPFAAMVSVSNAAFVLALPIIWHEARYYYGAKAADLAILLFAFLPGSYSFSSAQSGSLYLLLVMATLTLARRERWLWAGLTAALATLTRNVGVLLIIPIAVYAWQSLGAWRDPHVLSIRRFRIFVAMVLPATAFAGGTVYLWRHAGEPFTLATMLGAWKRELQNPLDTLIGPILNGGAIQTEIITGVIISGIGVAATLLLLARRNWAHAWFMVAVVPITLASGIPSSAQMIPSVAPAIMVVGAFFADRPRAWRVTFGIFSAANGFMMVCQALGLDIH